MSQHVEAVLAEREKQQRDRAHFDWVWSAYW